MRYETEHSIYKAACKRALRSAKKEISEILTLDVGKLKQFLSAYKANDKHQSDLRLRKDHYATARELLANRFLSRVDLSEADFREAYGELVGARGVKKLWHSGSVHPSINKIVPQHALMQAMVREVGARMGDSPEKMYERFCEWRKHIPHFGPNVFTEICNTLKPESFAVLNDNPTTGLKKLGRGSFPAPGSFKPRDYARYCETLGALRDACGFKDFGETDHFLNFVFWRTRNKEHNPVSTNYK